MARADVQSKIRVTKRPRTDDEKARQSDKLVGKMPKNLTVFVAGHRNGSGHGWIDLGNGRKYFMRSTWERNVARYYEFLRERGDIQNWEYEPQRFFFDEVRFGNRTYLPDFRITNPDGYQFYIEVKGWMDNDSKVKIKRMQKYFPSIELQIIDAERYKAIKKVAPLIKGWEVKK
jgi:predicted nuclease of restriction endonuclease-like RecB superfamily